MKKIYLLGAFFIASMGAFAQEATETTESTESGSSSGSLSFTSKNGLEVLPQAGDWGIGVGASNTAAYFGNLFNSNANNNGNDPFDFANENVPSVVLYGKQFVSSELAYRAFARLSYSRVVTKALVDADLNPDPDVYVTDTRTTNYSGITVGAGLEKRRGQGRLIGVYGAQAYINLDASTKTTYSYGNELSVQNQNPSDAGLQNSNTIAPDPAFGNRLLATKTGSSYGLGVQGFIGAEYYFAPKMSVSGEFYWGIAYTKNPVASETWEALEPSTQEVKEYSSSTVGGSSLTAGLSNLGGAINLMLYF